MNQCKNEVRTAVFVDQITLIEEWTESTYIHTDLQTLLITHLNKRNNRRFQDLEELPRSMKSIVEKKQDRIEWATIAEGRRTKGFRDM